MRSRAIACSSNATRSAARIEAWVGSTHAVGHRVIPFLRMNSEIKSRSSSGMRTFCRTVALPWHWFECGPCYSAVTTNSCDGACGSRQHASQTRLMNDELLTETWNSRLKSRMRTQCTANPSTEAITQTASATRSTLLRRIREIRTIASRSVNLGDRHEGEIWGF